MKERQCEYFPLALFDTGFERRKKLPILALVRNNFYVQGSSESKWPDLCQLSQIKKWERFDENSAEKNPI